MPNVVNTYANISPQALVYYDKHQLAFAEPNLVHNQFGQKRPIPANSGIKVNFRKFSKLPKATQALTEGVTPEGNLLRKSTKEATVSQYGAYIAYTDMMNLADIDKDMVEANKILSANAAETLDYITAQVLAGGSNVL